MVRSADTAAQLMELRETEFVSTLNDDRIGRRHINAGFNNRGTQEHVKALLIEVAHHMLKLAFAHLPVGNGNAGFGHKRFEPGAGVFDGVHFVMQVVDLSAAL